MKKRLCKDCKKSDEYFGKNICTAFDIKAFVTGKKALCIRKNPNGGCIQFVDGNNLFI